MHQFPWMWVMVGMFFWMFMMRPRRSRACEPRGSSGETDRPMGRRHRHESRDYSDGALAPRDALIARLEERVRVLERIATDDSARLRAEIYNLRDPPPRSGAAG